MVHLYSSKIGALGRVAFKPCKTIYTVHGFDSIRVANRSFLPVEKLLKGRCAKIVGVSKYDETNLYTEGITKHVTFVYNGITDYFEQEEEIISQPVKEKFEAIKLQYTKVVMCIAVTIRLKESICLLMLPDSYRNMLLFGSVMQRNIR